MYVKLVPMMTCVPALAYNVTSRYTSTDVQNTFGVVELVCPSLKENYTPEVVCPK
jgi:hypothetical protein